MNEHDIARALAAREGGECEVQTPAGFIDVLTPKIVYEVKEAAAWKAALGQVLAYARSYPERKPKLYLYGAVSGKQKAIIAEHCNALGVGVVWHTEPKASADSEQLAPPVAASKPDEMSLVLSARDTDYHIRSTITARLPVPTTALPREHLEAYADEAMQVFDALLDNELTLTLRSCFQGEQVEIQRTREGVRGSPVCYRLNLSIQTERARPFQVSIPGVKTVFPSGEQGYRSIRTALEVRRLYDFILHPEFRWTDVLGARATSISSSGWVSLGIRQTRKGPRIGRG